MYFHLQLGFPNWLVLPKPGFRVFEDAKRTFWVYAGWVEKLHFYHATLCRAWFLPSCSLCLFRLSVTRWYWV